MGQPAIPSDRDGKVQLLMQAIILLIEKGFKEYDMAFRGVLLESLGIENSQVSDKELFDTLVIREDLEVLVKKALDSLVLRETFMREIKAARERVIKKNEAKDVS